MSICIANSGIHHAFLVVTRVDVRKRMLEEDLKFFVLVHHLVKCFLICPTILVRPPLPTSSTIGHLFLVEHGAATRAHLGSLEPPLNDDPDTFSRPASNELLEFTLCHAVCG